MEEIGRIFQSRTTIDVVNSSCDLITMLAAVFVALIDVALGVITIFLCYFPIMDFHHISDALDYVGLNADALLWGIVSIPFFAFLGLVSGLNQLKCIWRRTPESPGAFKFSIFLIGEVLGFVLPYYFIEDYTKKVEVILGYGLHDQYLAFKLLLVNGVTICLAIYQFISFLVVYYYNSSNKMRNEQRKKLQKQQASTSTTTNGGNTRSAGTPQKIQPTIYPKFDLESMMNELQTLPAYCRSTSTTNTVTRVSAECMPLVTYKNGQVEIKESKRNLYEDLEFPPTKALAGLEWKTGIRWKRPHEINAGAQFFTDGISRFDVRQGDLGDCWFLAALANLTLNKDLFSRVVPHDNEWTGKTYTGKCHFNFFKDGEWQHVVIDDRLPTRAGKLIFMQSSDPSEFWSAMIEKAYAKLNGSYKGLIGNDGIGRAMINLTGGTVTRYYIREFGLNVQKLYQLMSTALETGKMVGCCCRARGDNSGIFGGHAYSVTGVAQMKFRTGKKVHCIRIRNPWGNEREWEGEFSDGHPIWDLVEPILKKQLQVKFNNDGEFWFPLNQLVDYFHLVEVCHCD